MPIKVSTDGYKDQGLLHGGTWTFSNFTPLAVGAPGIMGTGPFSKVAGKGDQALFYALVHSS